MRHEVKQEQKPFGVLQRRGLLQEYESIDHGEIWRRTPGPPSLYLAIQRGPSFRDLLQQLRDSALHGARVAEVNAHPVCGRKLLSFRNSNLARCGSILVFPS